MANPGRVLAWQLTREWSTAQHKWWPKNFKEVARMIVAATPDDEALNRAGSSGEAGLWSLPGDLLVEILRRAATPRGVWRGYVSGWRKDEGELMGTRD